MDEEEKNWIRDRYNERLDSHGNSIEALASGTKERRNIRFQILQEVGITTGDSVLDIGCGFGDFYGYLQDKGLEVDYVGYDINSRIVEAAREKFPGADFKVKDVLEENYPTFDYIVSSSTFNLPLKNHGNYNIVKSLLETTYEHASEGVSIDFLSSYVDYESEEGFHYKPEKIFSMAKSITKKVQLRHDYPLFEFNIYLYPDFEGWD